MRVLKTAEVIARAQKSMEVLIHTTSSSTETMGIITCPVHGDFLQLPLDHAVRGYGCNKCGYDLSGQEQRRTTEEWVLAAIDKHGDRYDYSQSQHLGSRNQEALRCPTPRDHEGLQLIEDLGYHVCFIWEHEYRKLLKAQFFIMPA